MKKVIIMGVFLAPFLGFAQLTGNVVYDPTQAANMTQQISNTSQQISQLDKSLDYMKKASDQIEKVNSYVRAIDQLTEITAIYQDAVKLAGQIRQNLPKVKSRESQSRILKNVSETLTSLQRSINLVSKVLSNDFFKMTDRERMELIKEERHKVLMKRVRLYNVLYSM